MRLSRLDDPNELKLIESEPQETFGHSLSEDETTTFASADTDTDSGKEIAVLFQPRWSYL